MTPALEQRRRALKQANETRSAHAAVRRAIRTQPRGRDREIAAGLIANPPAYARSLRVERVLGEVHGLGAARVREGLSRCGVAGSTPLGLLRVRERYVLAGWLAPGGDVERWA